VEVKTEVAFFRYRDDPTQGSVERLTCCHDAQPRLNRGGERFALRPNDGRLEEHVWFDGRKFVREVGVRRSHIGFDPVGANPQIDEAGWGVMRVDGAERNPIREHDEQK
jgi:hypothetical protein